MRYSTCDCGKTMWFGSDPPRRCEGCSDCGTNAWREHAEEHDMKPQFNPNTGEPKGGRCRKCHKRDLHWEHES